MLQILGKSSSINVRKVLWLCTELDLPYKLEHYGSGFQSTETEAFRALNPNAMVPVIQDDGFVLWESNAICRYLASKCQRHDLLPAHPASRAIVEQWMDWQATELNNSWRYAFMSSVRHSPAHQDPVLLALGVAQWNRHMTMIEQQLQRTGAHLVGADFTLADIVIGLSVNRWMMSPVEKPPLPAVTAYYERLSQRSGFMAHGRNGLA